MYDFPGLIGDRPRYNRVPVPQGINADPRDEVEVLLARGVPYIRTFTAGEDDRVARVVLQQIIALEINHGSQFRLSRSKGRHLLILYSGKDGTPLPFVLGGQTPTVEKPHRRVPG